MTLIQGRGVRGVVITNSLPSFEKCPYEVFNSFSFCLLEIGAEH